MPSVAEELAALRAQSLTKSHAEKLKDAGGLTTPEQAEASIKESNEKTRLANYTKDAAQNLKAGTKALDQDMELRMQQGARKKEDLKKKQEAAASLQAGAKGGVVDKASEFEAQKQAMKKQDQLKQKEASENLKSYNKAKVDGTPTKTPKPEEQVTPETVESSSDNAADEIPEVEDVPMLEEVNEDDSPNMSDFPMMPGSSNNNNTMVPPPRVQNRAEKKARKVMEKMGMNQVAGISRVTLKMRGGQGYYTIHQPDVFEKNGSYVVFGEARQGSGMGGGVNQQQQQAQAVQKLATAAEEKKVEDVTPAASSSTEAVEEEVVDETGVEPKDIELVISQAGCSRARAVTALKENNGDLVNAIMSLTT